MSLDLSLYLVTDTKQCADRGVAGVVRQAIAGGVTVVQVRDHDASGRGLAALTRAVIDAADGSGVPVIVDDRLDVALAAGAAGVHVGQSDLDPRDCRRIAGPDFIIGHSVSTLDQLTEANELAGTVDYLGVGAVFATATKPDHSTPLGVAGLGELVAASVLPTVAIGGINEANSADIIGTGVGGIAVVSAICAAADPQAAARALRAIVREAR